MRIQLRVLPLAAFVMASVSAFAASDPFDPELFLSPYGEAASPLITNEPEGACDIADAGLTEGPIAGLITSSPEEVTPVPISEEKAAEIGAPDAAVEIALHPSNFIASESETAALIAADMASLSETTGSIEVAEPICVDGLEDR
jgi:hypothetical protein